VLRVWQVVLQTQKADHWGRLKCLVILELLRAGEEIRTLDVNLGKVALYH
jgi:hypothetical protein